MKRIILLLAIAISIHAEFIVKHSNDIDMEKTLKWLSGNNQFMLQSKEGRVHSICGSLYHVKDENVTIVPPESQRIVLTGFNWSSGRYECMYSDAQTGNVLTSSSGVLPNFKTWKEAYSVKRNGEMRPYDYFIKFSDPGVDKLGQKLKSRESVRDRANDMGLTVTGLKEHESISVSQFITGLITINNDYFGDGKGHTVDQDTGEIIINTKVEKQMSILQKNGIWEQIKGKVQEGIVFFKSDNTSHTIADNAMQNQIKIFNFSQYFDKQIFGFYYKFMGTTWTVLFSYAVYGLLALVIFYSGTTLAIHLLARKIGKEDGEEAFPWKTRLVSIITVFSLSFAPLPSQDGMQTTVAKEFIGYAANMGATIADVVAGELVTDYLEYLGYATNQNNVKKLKAIDKKVQDRLFKQRLAVSFFRDHCERPYIRIKDEEGSFQRAKSHEQWRNDISVDWREGKSAWKAIKTDGYSVGDASPKYISEAGVVNSDGTIVSAVLCKDTELFIARNLDKIHALHSTLKAGIEKNFEDKDKESNLMVDLFADVQLNSSKMVGWMGIASVPLFHVFSKYAGLVDAVKDIPSKETLETAFLDSAANDQSNKSVSREIREEGEKGIAATLIASATEMATKASIYFMMPGFQDVYGFSVEIMKTGIGIIEGIIPTNMIDSAGEAIEEAGSKDNKEANGFFVSMAAIFVAIGLYMLLVRGLFSSLIALFVIIKIVLWTYDALIHFFVSPFLLFWQLTIKAKTDRLHSYVVDGFVIYMIKPSLIVFSVMIFIVTYELSLAVYEIIYSVAFALVDIGDTMFDKTVEGMLQAPIILATIRSFSDLAVEAFGVFLAYKIILSGDDMILKRFGYEDRGGSQEASQLIEQIKGNMGAHTVT